MKSAYTMIITMLLEYACRQGSRKAWKAKMSRHELGIFPFKIIWKIVMILLVQYIKARKGKNVKSETAQSHPCHLACGRRIRTETIVEIVYYMSRLASNPFHSKPDQTGLQPIKSRASGTERLKTKFLSVKTLMQISPICSTLIMHYADPKLDPKNSGL